MEKLLVQAGWITIPVTANGMLLAIAHARPEIATVAAWRGIILVGMVAILAMGGRLLLQWMRTRPRAARGDHDVPGLAFLLPFGPSLVVLMVDFLLPDLATPPGQAATILALLCAAHLATWTYVARHLLALRRNQPG